MRDENFCDNFYVIFYFLVLFYILVDKFNIVVDKTLHYVLRKIKERHFKNVEEGCDDKDKYFK